MADQLATYVAGILADAEFSIPVASVVAVELPELGPEPTGTIVQVYRSDARETKAGRGDGVEVESVITVLVTRRLDGNVTRSDLVGLLEEIRTSCRFLESGGSVWIENEIVVLWDADMLRSGTYAGLVRVTFAEMV